MVLPPSVSTTPLQIALVASILATTAAHVPADEPINPRPRQMKTELAASWHSGERKRLWKAANDCKLEVRKSRLHITSTGNDPYLVAPLSLPQDRYLIHICFEIEEGLHGPVSFYWADSDSKFSEERRVSLQPRPGHGWQVHRVMLDRPTSITALRLDPGTEPGRMIVHRLAVERVRLHPLTIPQVKQDREGVHFLVRNETSSTVDFHVADRDSKLNAGESRWFSQPLPKQVVAQAKFSIEFSDWPNLIRRVNVFNSQVKEPHYEHPFGNAQLQIAKDGTWATVTRNGKLLAALAPIVDRGRQIAVAKTSDYADNTWSFADGIGEWRVAIEGEELVVTIDANARVIGPVLRSFGRLKGAVFPGLEYLGRGESSSSRLDIETDEHLRFYPQPLHVTWPLMSCATDRATVSMTWNVAEVRPLFAAPDFIDGLPGQAMAIVGRKAEVRIRIADEPLEAAVLWGARRQGLPELPKPPLDRSTTRQLDLVALTKTIAGDDGWSHAAGKRWPRRFYADMASTLWRLGGPLPPDQPWQIGGAHIPNDAIFFVTGQVERWRRARKGAADNALRSQRPDGSFRYCGKFARGHFEDTASGYCAVQASRLLDWAYFSGDAEALQAGCKTLDFMQRFHTPRGAQTWEIPLHTPDLLASAYLVHAYVRGYQLTGKQQYLESARKWAVSGIPFVYLRADHDVMPYSTIAVFGATNWKAPNWIGLPVQWVGIVYAHSLALLAPHDDTFNWQRLAKGILVAARRMQYPDGPTIGLLPDSYVLSSQQRRPPDINPCSLVSLDLVLRGQVASLAVAAGEAHRVVGPFPMELKGDTLHVHGKPGVTYQLLVDGERTIEVQSKGEDIIRLE